MGRALDNAMLNVGKKDIAKGKKPAYDRIGYPAHQFFQ